MLRKLHDFIKRKYEEGDYQQAADSYYDWKNSIRAQINDDYRLGYDQAVADFENHRSFHHYPDKIISFSNALTSQRINEVDRFIRGYNAGIESTKVK
ncbi:hypothetical protein [Companilactobacillus furfuricola]|uniref:hypothetical protein n=1 Tax=Companilactobacillus furfuricola TaxID=1462575 RepID=UPI000F77F66C|nr:hypothetical protein [Companilactobacillus furfuricola]